MRISLGVSLVAVVCLCTAGWAQEKREERREERAVAPAVRREANDTIRHASADHQIAAFLYGCARNEVEISKLAEEKASNEEVRNFAAMMVKAHMPCVGKLEHAAGPLTSAHAPGTPAAEVRKEEVKEEVRDGKPDPGAKNVPATPRGARREAGDPRTKIGAEVRTVVEARLGGGAGFNWNTIHKQIADECLASAKAEFQKKEGADFDHCYIGQQIMAHGMMIDELKVLRTYASAEMRKDLDESSKMAAEHLVQAKKIAESMKGEKAVRVTNKPKSE